jgi:hypothetical protein
MKTFLALLLSTVCLGAFANENKDVTTNTEPQSVLVVESSVDENVCEDCNIRRRGLFRRGYVVTKHTVSNDSVSTTREVLDGCCNFVRSRTVTKSKCSCN